MAPDRRSRRLLAITCGALVLANANASTATTATTVADSSRPTPEAAFAANRLVEQFGPTSGEQTDILGTAAWHDAGFDGDGITVGVIDFFDVPSFWDEAEHGPTPVAGRSAACYRFGADCTDDFFDGIDLGGEDHGVAVVETILDVAPGVSIVVAQATTISDYRLVLDFFEMHDVAIISRSLGSRYDGPGDGRGPLDDLVAEAADRGMLWVNSAGNNARDSYYRHPVRIDGDLVAFGPSGTDTFLDLAGCIAIGGVRWADDWDLPAAQRTDYDVTLWESPTGDPAAGTVIERAQRRQRFGASPLESISTSRCPAPGFSFYLQVELVAGRADGDVLEILDYSSGIAEYTSAAGSAAVPIVDSDSPGVVAVGSIDPAASGRIADYSSRGPSADGRVLPDLVA
ncbi:MAG: S8 family serine peptidase, partial [Ilumatobacter sp.]|nr:S8 family serine peptidase [Ilumatobacter sp.]